MENDNGVFRLTSGFVVHSPEIAQAIVNAVNKYPSLKEDPVSVVHLVLHILGADSVENIFVQHKGKDTALLTIDFSCSLLTMLKHRMENDREIKEMEDVKKESTGEPGADTGKSDSND